MGASSIHGAGIGRRHPLAARRILRLALGVSLCLAFSQALAWPLSFVAPVIASLMLTLPVPRPTLRTGVVFVLALMTPLLLSLALLPFFEYARLAGILLLGLALFHTFHFTSRGGPAVLGNFLTIALTVTVTVGSVLPELLPVLLPALAGSTVCGIGFVTLAHLLLPDPPGYGPGGAGAPAAPPRPAPAAARRSALRALFVVLPVALVLLFSSASASYTPLMIKVAALGQQASGDDSRAMGRSLLASTFWGGVGAVICWQVLAVWPSLVVYVLLIALASLLCGRFVFEGPAMHRHAPTASYALLTLLVVLAPALTDSPVGSPAGAAFWSRLGLFVLVAVYGSLAVVVFDAFVPAPREGVPAGRGDALPALD
jgi:hypothetical protein